MRERREAFRDARLIVIASEGKDTERIYFKALAKEYTNPRVHVHVLERSENEQNNSSPEHVLKQLNDYKSQYELEADDELWLVVDKDRWTEAMLSRVATECSQEVANYGFYCIWKMPYRCHLKNRNSGWRIAESQKMPTHI